MEFDILGELRVRHAGREIDIGPRKQRLLLAVLLCHRDEHLSRQSLVDAVWAGEPPVSATDNVYLHVHRLRRALGPDRITSPGRRGYRLGLDDGELDADRFATLAGKGQDALRTGDLAAASRYLAEALALWRGDPFADLADEPALREEIARLGGERLAALESRIDADLGIGRHAAVLAELDQLVCHHPYREKFHAQRMLALYRAGRQAEALQAYRDVRARLAEELGIEPGPQLRDLERAVLLADPALAPVAVPAAADQPVPAQLPRQLPDFTGREEDLRRLDALAGEPGTLLITAIAGMAGVGKTALAVRWAHQVAHRYPDGQLYLNLHGFDASPAATPAQALTGLLRALGVPADRIPSAADEAAGLYRTHLSGKRMLIVLDNAGTAEQVRPLLPGSGGCLVVVTSRSRLGGLLARDGARRHTLDVLPRDEAIELLARVAGRPVVDREPQAAADLAAACGYLPLALRVAAANLCDGPHRSLGGYVAALRGDPIGGLRVDGDDACAVRRVFEHSYAALTPTAATLFRLLGLVPGGDFTVDAAAGLLGGDGPAAAELLGALTNAHLVEQRPAGRYALHDLLREYARELSGPAEAAAARARLYRWYRANVDAAADLLYPQILRLPHDGGPEPIGFGDLPAARAWLDAEHANLVSAVLAVPPADAALAEQAWLLADGLRGYFWLRRATADWLVVASTAHAAAEAAGDRRAQAAAHLSLGLVYAIQRDFARAAEHYTAVAPHAAAGGWPHANAAALGNLASICLQSGQLARAADLYEQVIEEYRRIGSASGQGIHLSNLGQLCIELGRLHAATGYLTRSLELVNDEDSASSAAHTHIALGAALTNLGEHTAAAAELAAGLALARAASTVDGELLATIFLARLHTDLGEFDRAGELAAGAVEVARSVRDPFYEADARTVLGTLLDRRGEYGPASDELATAVGLAIECEATGVVVEARVRLGSALLHRGDAAAAARVAAEALAQARAMGYRLWECEALLVLASAAADGGDPRGAASLREQALAIHRETGYRGNVAEHGPPA